MKHLALGLSKSLLSFTFLFLGIMSPCLTLAAGRGFGDFESGILQGSIDDASAPDKGGLVGFIDVVITIVLGVVIGLGLIVFVIGGYVYMSAGGDAGKLGTAKTIMGAALLGIVLAIAAQLILNELSPQFAEQIQNPKFPK